MLFWVIFLMVGNGGGGGGLHVTNNNMFDFTILVYDSKLRIVVGF